ncbi:MAG: hypothetical protein JO284_05855 [Planctomycetaceae bacterium]|nr:hypothetical protein [Planctomycetaceae bacterium]MBV8231319.1 hypothetical protein [Planctomycetaceae bacterium]MBV8266505.1 hypothetical protein [Planctomycetaceae bacterium]MBV8558575.1 hypothetical protein [Planctomycetaceae bacterium]
MGVGRRSPFFRRRPRWPSFGGAGGASKAAFQGKGPMTWRFAGRPCNSVALT